MANRKLELSAFYDLPDNEATRKRAEKLCSKQKAFSGSDELNAIALDYEETLNNFLRFGHRYKITYTIEEIT